MTNWMTGVCEAGGANIHYLRTGGARPSLVLLHGLTGNGACWSPLARSLEREFDVVMPDARGHGKSSTPLHGYRYDDHAGDVVGLLSLNKDNVLAEARIRHPHRSSEIVGLLAEARLQTRLSAFDVLTPPNPEYHQLVSTICVPILLVIGDVPVVSIETARELQSLNPRVRVKQIQNAGHGVPYDQPERFAAVVRSFLRPVAS